MFQETPKKCQEDHADYGHDYTRKFINFSEQIIEARLYLFWGLFQASSGQKVKNILKKKMKIFCSTMLIIFPQHFSCAGGPTQLSSSAGLFWKQKRRRRPLGDCCITWWSRPTSIASSIPSSTSPWRRRWETNWRTSFSAGTWICSDKKPSEKGLLGK